MVYFYDLEIPHLHSHFIIFSNMDHLAISAFRELPI